VKDNTFGKNIRAAREGAELSQAEVGIRIGMSTRLISYLEAGKIEPSLDNLVKISKLFEASTDDLLGVND